MFDGICRDIGYCPQSNCIIDYLTLEDYFYLFGRLRAIRYDQLEQIIETISNLFLLDLYLKQYIQQLSGGTIRRMHAALACLGSPNILLLGKRIFTIESFT